MEASRKEAEKKAAAKPLTAAEKLFQEEVAEGEIAESTDEEIKENLVQAGSNDLFAAAKLHAAEMQELTGDYLRLSTLEKGKDYFFILLGFGEMFNEKIGEMAKTVRLEREDNSKCVCAAKVLVDTCMQIHTLPCAIKLVYKGRIKSAKGEYDSISVSH